MKIEQLITPSSVIGEVTSQQFGIDTTSGVIFDILRNKMYSNVVSSICREISCNAKDANTENNLSEKPTKITLVSPSSSLNYLGTITDYQIIFEDHGIGIQPDRMNKIFLNYGASTKRDSNDLIGGLGLGAKTPFAYSDTFTVLTVCNWKKKRMKYVYTATILIKVAMADVK